MRTLLAAAGAAFIALTVTTTGAAIDQDVDRALAAARAQAAAGDAVAQFSLGSLLYSGAADTAQAIDWLRKAAAQRYAPAEYHLGQLYDFGFGVPADDATGAGLVPPSRRSWQRERSAHGRRVLPERAWRRGRSGRSGALVSSRRRQR